MWAHARPLRWGVQRRRYGRRRSRNVSSRTPRHGAGSARARISDDVDIFGDGRDRVPHSESPELEALRQAGFSIELTTIDESMVAAIVNKYGFETKVQWLDDPETSRRFFPVVDEGEFDFRLHQADVAVNKLLCASRRVSARTMRSISSRSRAAMRHWDN